MGLARVVFSRLLSVVWAQPGHTEKEAAETAVVEVTAVTGAALGLTANLTAQQLAGRTVNVAR